MYGSESGFGSHVLVKVENAMHILSCSRSVQIHLCHPMCSWCVGGLTHSRRKGDAGSIFILHSTVSGEGGGGGGLKVRAERSHDLCKR